MKKILILGMAVALTGCGIYKPYSRPEVETDGLYGQEWETADTTTIADVSWREMFTDPYLQSLIEQGLENNLDLQSAGWRLEEAEASLKSARLAFLPAFNLAPQGSGSSFDGSKVTWTYNVPVTASWEIDIFSRLRNSKLQAKALYAQSKEYRQAVRTQLIAGIANYYYTLLMLDKQYAISLETAGKYKESVKTMQAMMDAGMTNRAGVSQMEATYYSVENSLRDMAQSIKKVENSLCLLLGEAPRAIERGSIDAQALPDRLLVGVPLQLLSRRPDVKSSELALEQAFYGTAAARSALYPSLTLSGSAGWTNNAGMVVNPGKILLSAAGSLVQPLFNANANRARVRIAQAQQEEAKLSVQQTLLNAGSEVNNALTQYQTALSKVEWRNLQIESLESAVESTQLLMQHSSTTYLEVLTAQQALLSAQLSQVNDQFDRIQAVVNLYHALGGGRETDAE